ncbi:MAG TPA: 50S ribosomal protein L25 [Anaerolineaceae bacterium]|nr:50S ribosomal protein L25 [Anaerolineaceae bacterium]
MSKIILNAEPRTVTGKQVRQLRREGKLPAVIYGSKIDSKAITLDLRGASKILSGATSSSLVTIVLDGKEYPSLVREKQIDFILGTLKHVDFLAVSLKDKIKASVSIVFEGEAPAVKEFNAILSSGLSQIEIEAYPQDLPESFTVDISVLVNLGDSILVKDINVPENVEILSDPEELVLFASSMKAEAEEEEEEEIVGEDELEEIGEPEVIEKGKKEEEEE